MRSLSWIASLAAVWLCAADARAGLIFELDGIDARHIDAAHVVADRITLTSRGHARTIQVPDGTGALLVAWARQDTGGPLVFSIDGSLVSTGGDSYWPPSVPVDLGQLLFAYDAYAHDVACGGTPRNRPERHPLIQSAGERMMPHRQHDLLLDAATRTPQAYAYRRLTERFVDPPGCVGELSLYAMPGAAGSPVAIQPRSWIHMLTSQWYRGIDVPSESDKWVARLPYQPLKQDIERRWPTYRAAFHPLDSLSSIVEAMAVLRAIRRDAPAVWATVERDVPRRGRPDDLVEPLGSNALAVPPWRQLARERLGSRIETPADANLALSLALSGDDSVRFDGFAVVAARDPVTAAKLALARLLSARDPEQPGRGLIDESRRFFETVSRIPGAFRLRAVAVVALEASADSLLGDRADLDDGLAAVLVEQRAALATGFLQRAEAACRAGSNDLALWEDLSQDVYSVGLLGLVARDGGRLPPRVAAAIACIHFHRGMAAQQGRQLAYRHAHYRFLKYLASHTDDVRTRRQVARYRQTLAAAMNLHDSDLGAEVQP